jgi:predicted dehydrogenase
MTKLRWGILGTARINRMLIPPLRVSPHNRLVAVASRELARGEAYAREWEIGRVHGSYEALLADPEIDAVYIPLPNHLHAEWTIKAARAGRHVLCEKPIALTLDEVDAMAAACREAGVVLPRHSCTGTPDAQVGLLDSGAIGTLHLAAASSSAARRRELRRSRAAGALDVGCYPLNFARFLVGREPLEVYASQVLGATGIDETFAGQVVFPGDVLFQLDAGFRSPARAEMELAGSEGAIRVRHPWRPEQDYPLLVTRDGRAEAISVPGEDRFLLEIEDLAEAVRTGRPPRVSPADSRANVAALVALQRSAREGRPVRL